MTAENDQDYIDYIEKILYEPGFSGKIKENIGKYKKDLLWEQIAKKHLVAYEEVITVPYGKARYFYNPEPE